jgi:hypothetical protein
MIEKLDAYLELLLDFLLYAVALVIVFFVLLFCGATVVLAVALLPLFALIYYGYTNFKKKDK